MRHRINYFAMRLFLCLAFIWFGSAIAYANIQPNPAGAVEQAQDEVEKAEPRSPEEGSKESRRKKILGVLFAVAVILPLTCMALVNGRRRNCPKCGQKGLAVRDSEVIESRPSKDIVEVTYVCSNCGGEVRRRETVRAGTPAKK